jgi:hypothetical protein
MSHKCKVILKNFTELVFNGTFFAMTIKVRFSNSCENYAHENNVSIGNSEHLLITS